MSSFFFCRWSLFTYETTSQDEGPADYVRKFYSVAKLEVMMDFGERELIENDYADSSLVSNRLIMWRSPTMKPLSDSITVPVLESVPSSTIVYSLIWSGLTPLTSELYDVLTPDPVPKSIDYSDTVDVLDF